MTAGPVRSGGTHFRQKKDNEIESPIEWPADELHLHSPVFIEGLASTPQPDSVKVKLSLIDACGGEAGGDTIIVHVINMSLSGETYWVGSLESQDLVKNGELDLNPFSAKDGVFVTAFLPVVFRIKTIPTGLLETYIAGWMGGEEFVTKDGSLIVPQVTAMRHAPDHPDTERDIESRRWSSTDLGAGRDKALEYLSTLTEVAEVLNALGLLNLTEEIRALEELQEEIKEKTTEAGGKYPEKQYYVTFAVDPGGKQVTVTPIFTHNRGEGRKERAVYGLAHVDADVDSDNSGQIDGTVEEDNIEDDPNKPGKIVQRNDLDADSDGIPDYADGFNRWEGESDDDKIDKGQPEFCPINLTLSGAAKPSDVRVRFQYPGADPSSVERTENEDGTYDYSSGVDGEASSVRLWLKDADKERDGASTHEEGDYVKPGAEIEFEDLPGAGPQRHLYLEGIEPGQVRIAVEMDLKSDQDDKFEETDAVRVSVLGLNLVDTPAWWSFDSHGRIPIVVNIEGCPVPLSKSDLESEILVTIGDVSLDPQDSICTFYGNILKYDRSKSGESAEELLPLQNPSDANIFTLSFSPVARYELEQSSVAGQVACTIDVKGVPVTSRSQRTEFTSSTVKIVHIGDKDHSFELNGEDTLDNPIVIDAYSNFYGQPKFRGHGTTEARWKTEEGEWRQAGKVFLKEYARVQGSHDAYFDDGDIKIKNEIAKDWTFPEGPENGGHIAGCFYFQGGGFAALNYLTQSYPPSFITSHVGVGNLGHKCYFVGYYGLITRPDSSGLNHKYVDHHQGKGHIQLRAFKGTRMFFHWDTPGYPGDRWTLWAALKRQFGDPFDISFKALNGKDPVSWTLDLPLSLVMDWLAYLHDDPLDQTASFLARPGIKVLKPDGEERNPGEDDPDFGVDYGSLVSIGLGLGFDWDQRKHWQEVIHRKNQDAVKWFRTDINHTHPITVYPGDTVTVGFGANLNALVKVLNDYDIHRSKALLFWPPPKGKERKVLLW